MNTQNNKPRPFRRVLLLLTPVIALLLVGWGVKSSGYDIQGLYKSFTNDIHVGDRESLNRPTIQGLIDTLEMKSALLEKEGEIQRSIDTLERAVSLRYNQVRLEDRLAKLYHKKKELQNEYYAQLPTLPMNEGCTGARMGIIKKIYKLDRDSISATLRKELKECK